jgi:predicted small secreted protein
MKRLCATVLISILTTTVSASELAGSFKQAADLAEAQDKIDAAIIYEHRELTPYYQKKYSPVYQACLKSVENGDTSAFSFVAAIGKHGEVLRLYVDHETNIYACVRETLHKDKFPQPPFSPYYMHISMSFQ